MLELPYIITINKMWICYPSLPNENAPVYNSIRCFALCIWWNFKLFLNFQVPPDPRAFEKPRRACTPQSGSRPLPAPPPERHPSDDRPTPTEPRPDRQPPPLPDNRIPDRPTDRHTPETRHERHPPNPPENRTDRLLPNLECRQERLAPSISDSRIAPDRVERPPERHILLPENRINLERPLHTPNVERERNVTPHNVELRQPPERPPDKPDRSSFDRDRVENRAPPRQRSLPSTTSGSVDHQPTKSTTMPKFPSEDTKDPPYENVAVEKNELAVGRKYCLTKLFPYHFNRPLK